MYLPWLCMVVSFILQVHYLQIAQKVHKTGLPEAGYVAIKCGLNPLGISK